MPLSMSMRSWLLGRGQLPIASKSDLETEGGYKNPYTFSGAALTSILARVVNAYHDYCTLQEPDEDPMEAEIERLRLYNEVVLYTARFCEVVIKQLLYCTQLPERRYARKSLDRKSARLNSSH